MPELTEVRSFLENINVSKKLDAASNPGIKRKFLQINETDGLDRLTAFMGLVDYLAEKVDLWTSLYTGIPQKKYLQKACGVMWAIAAISSKAIFFSKCLNVY